MPVMILRSKRAASLSGSRSTLGRSSWSLASRCLMLIICHWRSLWEYDDKEEAFKVGFLFTSVFWQSLFSLRVLPYHCTMPATCATSGLHYHDGVIMQSIWSIWTLMMCFHHNSFNVSSFQLLRGSEHQRKLLEGLLQRGWKQVFFLEELKSLVFVHPSSFSIWIHTMLKPRIAFLGRAQSDSLGKLHGNAFNSIFQQKCPVFGTLFDAEAGTREFPQHFSPGLFHYYATSSSLNEKSFERNQQLSIIKF